MSGCSITLFAQLPEHLLLFPIEPVLLCRWLLGVLQWWGNVVLEKQVSERVLNAS